MNTLLPKFVGPINQGSSFVILSVYPSPTGTGGTGITGITGTADGYPTYILNINTSKQYFWDMVASDDQISSAPVFTAVRDTKTPSPTGSFGENYFLTDTQNGAVSIDSNNLLVAGPQGSSLRITNGIYQLWEPPTLFLSNVPYGVYDSNGRLAEVLGPTGTGVYALDFIFVPTTWYSMCTSRITGKQVSGVVQSVSNWACMANNNQPYCAGAGIDPLPNGFTNLTDCYNDLIYSYCPTGEFCSYSNCNGMCQNRNDDCVNEKTQFTCKFDPRKYLKDEPWWDTLWFKILVLCLIVATIGVIVILIVIVVTKKPKKPADSGPTETQKLLLAELAAP